MPYLWRIPAPPLDAYVERLWLVSDEPPQAKERIVPSSTIDLGFNLRENKFRVYDAANPERSQHLSGAAVSGTRSRPIVIDTREMVSVIGVRFKPGSAFPFLGTPASELADVQVDLETLWGTSARKLRERLCEAKTPNARFDLLEKALVAHLRRPVECHYAVRFALDRFAKSNARLAVRDVARDAGLSQRRFIQVFTREVGMSPKQFSRIQRFWQALEAVRRSAVLDWARLAADCGYYDQSHLIHDFRSFSSLSPTEFARQLSGCAVQNHATRVA